MRKCHRPQPGPRGDNGHRIDVDKFYNASLPSYALTAITVGSFGGISGQLPEAKPKPCDENWREGSLDRHVELGVLVGDDQSGRRDLVDLKPALGPLAFAELPPIDANHARARVGVVDMDRNPHLG